MYLKSVHVQSCCFAHKTIFFLKFMTLSSSLWLLNLLSHSKRRTQGVPTRKKREICFNIQEEDPKD